MPILQHNVLAGMMANDMALPARAQDGEQIPEDIVWITDLQQHESVMPGGTASQGLGGFPEGELGPERPDTNSARSSSPAHSIRVSNG